MTDAPQSWTPEAQKPLERVAHALRNVVTVGGKKVKVLFVDKRPQKGQTPSGRQKASNVAYPDASREISDVRESIGKGRRETYRNILAKHRPDLDADKVLAELGKFDNTKKEKVALHWVVRGTIRLPEDGYKIDDALSVAAKAKVDPFMYDSPMELIEAHKKFKPTAKAIDPRTVPELSKPRDEGDGIVSYEVEGTLNVLSAVKRALQLLSSLTTFLVKLYVLSREVNRHFLRVHLTNVGSINALHYIRRFLNTFIGKTL